MYINKHHVQQPYPLDITLDIRIDNQSLQQVSHFTYLGSSIACDGSLDHELNNRIGKSSGAFNSINNVWRNRGIHNPIKFRIYESAVLTILLYGGDTWHTTQKQLQRLEAFHQLCMRQIL